MLFAVKRFCNTMHLVYTIISIYKWCPQLYLYYKWYIIHDLCSLIIPYFPMTLRKFYVVLCSYRKFCIEARMMSISCVLGHPSKCIMCTCDRCVFVVPVICDRYVSVHSLYKLTFSQVDMLEKGRYRTTLHQTSIIETFTCRLAVWYEEIAGVRPQLIESTFTFVKKKKKFYNRLIVIKEAHIDVRQTP